MDLQILCFTITDRIIHVAVMSHSGEDYRKEEFNLQKWCFFMFYRFNHYSKHWYFVCKIFPLFTLKCVSYEFLSSTIPFLYIDEVKRKAPTWLRSQSHLYIRRNRQTSGESASLPQWWRYGISRSCDECDKKLFKPLGI
jgi:hypothetical protein